MRASDHLRAATGPEHKAAEIRLEAASILNGSLSVAGFSKMIGTHYQVWSTMVNWWPEDVTAGPKASKFLNHMVEQLRLDLEAIGIAIPSKLRLCLASEPVATRYGALYVLRGSTLGGTIINRKLRACAALESLPAFHFHAACEALPGKEWPVFLRELNAAVQTEEELAQAISGAKAVFGLYLL